MAIATVTETTDMVMADTVIMTTAIGITDTIIMTITVMATVTDTGITATEAFRSTSQASDMCSSAGDDSGWEAPSADPRQ